MPRKKKELPDTYKKFCEEYVNCLNKTKAYLRAFPKAKPNTAASQSHKLLAKPAVQNYIEQLFQERQKKFELNEKKIIEKLKQIIDTDPIEIFGKDYQPKNLEEIPENIRKLIKKISVVDGKVTVELPDKVEAITKLGQHIGMFGSKSQSDTSKFLVRIYVVPAINYKIQLPDKRKVAKELITDKLQIN